MTALPKASDLADMLSISPSYAHALLKGDRTWTNMLALKLHSKNGMKVGPIADATDDEIAVLTRFEKLAA